MSIGSYLKEQRHSSGKTLQDIADRLKLSDSYVSQLETGARLPSPKQFSSLAKAYGLSEEELKQHWFDTKLNTVVGMATTYKFGIKDAVARKAQENTQPLEERLSALQAKLDRQMEVPLLAAVPVKLKALDGQIKKAEQYISVPKTEADIPAGHRLFAVKASFLELPEAGVMASDFIILDPDDKASAGDLVLVATPKGLALTYFNIRGGNIELPMNNRGQIPFFRLKQVEVLGKIIYHIKKF